MSWLQPPPLPQPCACGNTNADHCPEIGLDNHRNFPPFAHLPDYNDVDPGYYSNDNGQFACSPSRHWIFVGEILENKSDFIRPRALVKSKFGEEVLVNFHLEDAKSPAFFQWKDILPGSTMCVMYAKNREFMDFNRGIREEYSKCSMVFPANLEQLTDNCKSLLLGQDCQTRRCFRCNEIQAEGGEPFKRCSKCKLALYCSKDCQRQHWAECHKKLCPHMKTLIGLVTMDFSRFEGFKYWDFVAEPLPTPEERREQYRQATHEFFRARGVEPLSKGHRFRELLDKIKDKILDNDSVWNHLTKKLCKGGFHDILEKECPDLLSGALASNALFMGLKILSEKYATDASERNHVIDMPSINVSGALGESMNDIRLSTLFFALPQWQSELGIRQIIWAVEMDHGIIFHKECFPGTQWLVEKESSDGFVAFHRQYNDDRCIFNDEPELVAMLADILAEKFSECLVVRVLRADAGQRAGIIRQIASKRTLDNLVTLWIRENNRLLGCRFRPLNPDLPWTRQLMDFEQLDPVLSLLYAMGVPDSQILRQNHGNDDLDDQSNDSVNELYRYDEDDNDDDDWNDSGEGKEAYGWDNT